MFVRITIDIYILPLEVRDGEDEPPSPPSDSSTSAELKAEFNDYLEAVGGFANFADGRLRIPAETMLDDPSSVLESLDVENRYLLTGYYESEFCYVYIDWEQGKQPRVLKVEREPLIVQIK